jgi:hypothetical protein
VALHVSTSVSGSESWTTPINVNRKYTDIVPWTFGNVTFNPEPTSVIARYTTKRNRLSHRQNGMLMASRPSPQRITAPMYSLAGLDMLPVAVFPDILLGCFPGSA